jgi:hypothetical protein
MRSSDFLLAGLLLIGVTHNTLGDEPKRKPVKVFILAGQSNMQGQGIVQAKDKEGRESPGTLVSMLKDAAKAPLLKHLVDRDGNWAEKRDDVWVYDVSERGSRHGSLEFGYGWDLGNKMWFGPELQFGHLLGNHCGSQVLIIKTAWGGKDLYKGFRPPSSGGAVGPFYKEMLSTVNTVIGDLKTQFPGYGGGGYELAGFVWWHGWNDFCDPKNAVPEYEKNLVNLINDVRHDLKAPKLPVVIGEFTGPWGADCKEAAALAIRKAQANAAARPEFKGTVTFVETHDFVRAEKDSPTKEGYHEFKNGETYFLVGDALAKGMIKLLAPSPKEQAEPAKPTSHTDRKLEDWTIHVDDRLQKGPDEALGTRALRFLEGKLMDIKAVVPEDRLKKLQSVTIVLDLSHGRIGPMQYHPDANWLRENGYSTDLAKCVHIPEAADLPTRRHINEQPWVILHELAHAYHDQILGFDEPRIKDAYEKFKKSGHGDNALMYNGKRGRHYALTDHKEFFAEMTEAYFGVNDFFPFNRAELREAEPEIFALLRDIWESPPKGKP